MSGHAPVVPRVEESFGGPAAARPLGLAGAVGGWSHGGLNLCRGGVYAVPTVVPTRYGPTPRAGHHSLISGPRDLVFQKGINLGK